MLLEALAAGRTSVADPRSRIDIVAWDAHRAIGPGQTLRTARAEVPVEVQALTSVAGMVLQIIDVRPEDCVADPRWDGGGAPTYRPTVVHEVSVTADARLVVNLEASAGQTLVARLLPEEGVSLMSDGVALTAPVRITEE
jgi:hypothetical protein